MREDGKIWEPMALHLIPHTWQHVLHDIPAHILSTMPRISWLVAFHVNKLKANQTKRGTNLLHRSILTRLFSFLIGLSDFPCERKKKKRKLEAQRTYSSHYSPLNCSSSAYFDVLSLRYSELRRACISVVTHLMALVWAEEGWGCNATQVFPSKR